MNQARRLWRRFRSWTLPTQLGTLSAVVTITSFLLWQLLPAATAFLFPDTALVVSPRHKDLIRTAEHVQFPVTVRNPRSAEKDDVALLVTVTPPLPTTSGILMQPGRHIETATRGHVEMDLRSMDYRWVENGSTFLLIRIGTVYANEVLDYTAHLDLRGVTDSVAVAINEIGFAQYRERVEAHLGSDFGLDECFASAQQVTPASPPAAGAPTCDPENIANLASSAARDGTFGFRWKGTDWAVPDGRHLQLFAPIERDGMQLNIYRGADNRLHADIRTPYFAGGGLQSPIAIASPMSSVLGDLFIAVSWSESGARLFVNGSVVDSIGVWPDASDAATP